MLLSAKRFQTFEFKNVRCNHFRFMKMWISFGGDL